MAGVAEMLCHYGGKDDKVLQLEQLDPFGFSEYYNRTETFDNLMVLIDRAEKIQKDYDKIVIHDYAEFRHNFPKKKVNLMFHGTKLRQMDEVERSAVSTYPCFVTTLDLLDILPNAVYIPNPVDLELFKQQDFEESGESWLCMNRTYQRDFIEKKIKEIYPKINYYPRIPKNIIKYVDMPFFLSQYTDYVDWKFTYDKPDPKSLPHPSCTGLQALAVGCTVHDRNGMVLDRKELLIHDAKRVTERFLKELG